jgi:hypothetical protein
MIECQRRCQRVHPSASPLWTNLRTRAEQLGGGPRVLAHQSQLNPSTFAPFPSHDSTSTSIIPGEPQTLPSGFRV